MVLPSTISEPLRRLIESVVKPGFTPRKNFHQTYRPEIDGLRAVAILPVVGFHAFPEAVRGGYVGVDVFFVISGYLISTIIFGSLERSSFSFIDFYINRVRRIFPALVLVLAVTLFLGWNLLLGREFKQLGTHVAAGAAFVENFVLWSEAGYFDTKSELKPLLHLWSLAIEEQFYLVFPLLAWLAWRLRLGMVALPLAIFALSFGYNLYLVKHDPVGAFFLPQTRCWELMAGVLVAWSMHVHGAAIDESAKWKAGILLHEAMVAAGIACILLAVISFDSSTPYPGVNAVLPVAGSALVILGGKHSAIAGWVLGNRAFVAIGKISYPLYLWHWPLLSLALYTTAGTTLPVQTKLYLVAASFGLAVLTNLLIERPISRSKSEVRPAIALGLIALCVAVGTVGWNSAIIERHYAANVQRVIDAWDMRGYPQPEGLYVEPIHRLPALGHNEHDKILFVGDSHALQYQNTIASMTKRAAASGNKTPPATLFAVTTGLNFGISQAILDDKSIKTVVFSFFWALQYGSPTVNEAIRCCGDGPMGIVGTSKRPSTSAQMDAFDAQLTAVTEALIKAGKRVYFILDNPFGEELLPRMLLHRSFFKGIEVRVQPLSKRAALERSEPVRLRVLQIAARTNSVVIDPIDHLCGSVCPALSEDGNPIYKDYDHLAIDVVISRVRYLDPLFSER